MLHFSMLPTHTLIVQLKYHTSQTFGGWCGTVLVGGGAFAWISKTQRRCFTFPTTEEAEYVLYSEYEPIRGLF